MSLGSVRPDAMQVSRTIPSTAPTSARASSQSGPARLRSGVWLRAALAFAFWTGIGFLFSTQIYFLTPEGSWLAAMRSAMPRWYAWGLLTPFIFAADRSLLRTRPLLWRLLLHVPLGLFFTFMVEALRYGAQVAFTGGVSAVLPFLIQGTYWDILIYGLIVGVYVAWDSTAEAQQRQLREAQLEAHLAEAHLRTLQAQLHPHFLFNALNTISAYTETEPRMARRMMAQLGELLRASLDHAAEQEVPLQDELAFLDNYLAIERLRFEDRLTVEVRVENGVRDALVPSFILQPLVENAIRHGTGTQMRRGHILITARRKAQWLALSVEDDGAGLPAGWRLEDHGGVGLLNTVQRLEELYGSAHHFHIAGAPGAGVCVHIELPYRSVQGNERPTRYASEIAPL
jgi:two-component system, LytTR family, sensor kinase